jgi:hypothetical protein
MASLGRPPASSPLTSADIPAGSVSAVKVASDVATQAELDAQKTNSSITTLGTVTAGNLANTAIVYPAGHVITMESEPASGTAYVGPTDGSYTSCGNYAITINKKLGSTSKIVLTCTYNLQMYWTGTGFDSRGYTKWVRSAPTAWTSPLFYGYWADEFNTERAWNIYLNTSNAFTDTSSATGNHTYTMWVGDARGHHAVTTHPAHIIAMEVKI